MQIGHGKQGVLIGQYEGDRSTAEPSLIESPSLADIEHRTDQNRILGYIEPACDNPQWILWFTAKGDAILYTKRGPDGAVEGDAVEVKGRQE
jgi:hypothetical protein